MGDCIWCLNFADNYMKNFLSKDDIQAWIVIPTWERESLDPSTATNWLKRGMGFIPMVELMHYKRSRKDLLFVCANMDFVYKLQQLSGECLSASFIFANLILIVFSCFLLLCFCLMNIVHSWYLSSFKFENKDSKILRAALAVCSNSGIEICKTKQLETGPVSLYARGTFHRCTIEINGEILQNKHKLWICSMLMKCQFSTSQRTNGEGQIQWQKWPQLAGFLHFDQLEQLLLI